MHSNSTQMKHTHINANRHMKNAFEYNTHTPASFSRATIVNNRMVDKTLYISGTSTIGPNGETLHVNDFAEQVKQTYRNLEAVLYNGDFDWTDVARFTIYLKDIERDYDEFNKLRKEWFDSLGINIYPASTCIQAKLCRPELLIEIEAIAIKYVDEDEE